MLTRRFRLRKIRRAVARRLFERSIARSLGDPAAGVDFVGSDYGGWLLPRDTVVRGWTCYCVGAGKDISFDLALARRFGARIVCLDPHDEARAYVERAAAGVEGFQFLQVALAKRDGPLRMFVAEDPNHIALSAADLQRTGQAVRVMGRSLSSLMAELGDRQVDLLKADLEGAEYEILEPGLASAAGVRVLCFELHASVPPRRALAFVAGFEAAGYCLVGRRGMQLTFHRRKAPPTARWRTRAQNRMAMRDSRHSGRMYHI